MMLMIARLKIFGMSLIAIATVAAVAEGYHRIGYRRRSREKTVSVRERAEIGGFDIDVNQNVTMRRLLALRRSLIAGVVA
jgi:hypothetical protein